MSFILQPWHIVLLAVSRNFNDTGADDYLRGTGNQLPRKSLYRLGRLK